MCKINGAVQLAFLILSIIRSSSAFYFKLAPDREKCFNSTAFTGENLLIEVQLPILDAGAKSFLRVFRGSEVLNSIELQAPVTKVTADKPKVTLNDVQEEDE